MICVWIIKRLMYNSWGEISWFHRLSGSGSCVDWLNECAACPVYAFFLSGMPGVFMRYDKCCSLHYQMSKNNPQVNRLTQADTGRNLDMGGQNLANDGGPTTVMVGSGTFVSSGTGA
jgi:hypothetical protein